MNAVSKTLIPNKEWIIEDNGQKVGSLAKKRRGYDFLRKGRKWEFTTLDDVKKQLGISIVEGGLSTQTEPPQPINYSIYDYPCSGKPFAPLYNLKKKLPLFAKSLKSQSLYCAGYYAIKFRKGWVKSYCPKFITLERYQFHGPFKTELEMKNILNILNKL